MRGVTRFVALALVLYIFFSSTSKTSSPELAPAPTSTPFCVLTISKLDSRIARSRDRRPQEVDVLQSDASIVALPPALQSVFHHACSASRYEQLHRCQGLPDRRGSTGCGKNVICILERLEYSATNSLSQAFRLGKARQRRASVITPNCAG